jgi:hypothetical protein
MIQPPQGTEYTENQIEASSCSVLSVPCGGYCPNVSCFDLVKDHKIPGDFRLGGFVGQRGVDQEIE